MKHIIATTLRTITENVVFGKKLPKSFGSATIFVTPRSDLRLIYPGYKSSASDLMIVAKKFVRTGDCVWDIGSNLGIFSVCAAFSVGENGRVFTCEADPKYAALQSETFARLASGYARPIVLCAAVADRVGVSEFVVSGRGHARSHLAGLPRNELGRSGALKQVLSVTLDFLLDHWHTPNFVKIDIEGAESLALSGAERLLKEVRPVFYIEVSHPNEIEVTARFKDAGYEIFKLDSDGRLSLATVCGLYTIAKPRESVSS